MHYDALKWNILERIAIKGDSPVHVRRMKN